jgi:hypothetical protein
MTKKPDPKPRIPATPLSDEDRAELVALAAEVSASDEATAQVRERQNRLWEYLIGLGVSKSEIAKASRVSATAISFRVGRPFPSRVNRGAGRARVNR